MTARRTLFALLTLVLVAGTAFGRSKPQSGGIGWFGPTLAFVDPKPLNDALSARFTPTKSLGSSLWGFGGGGYALIERVVIGGSGWGGDQYFESESLNAKVTLGGGEFDMGYAVVSIPHLIIAPMLGIGGTSYDVELSRRGELPLSFDDLLQMQGLTSKVSTTSFSLNPHLVLTIPISFVGLQLRGGYLYTPAFGQWEMADGGRELAGPVMGKGTPYASLNVVFGGFDRGGKSKTRVKVIKKFNRNDDD